MSLRRINESSLFEWFNNYSLPNDLKPFFSRSFTHLCYISLLGNFKNDDAYPTRKNPVCTFCRQDNENRYLFEGLSYSYNYTNMLYFFCESTLNQICDFNNVSVISHYMLNKYLVHDVSRLILWIYLDLLKITKPICKNEEKMKQERMRGILLYHPEKKTINDLKYFMSEKGIHYPKNGSGKNGGILRADYIQAIELYKNMLKK